MRPVTHTVSDILAAAAASAAPGPQVEPVGAPRRHRPALLLAGALTIIAVWTATAVTLQVKANRAKVDAVGLVKGDRHLQELELLSGRTLSGELNPIQAAVIGQRHRRALDQSVADAGGSPALRADLAMLRERADRIQSAVLTGDTKAYASQGGKIAADIQRVDGQLDADIDASQRSADRASAFAWQFTAGSGALTLLVAGLLLVVSAARGARPAACAPRPRAPKASAPRSASPAGASGRSSSTRPIRCW